MYSQCFRRKASTAIGRASADEHRPFGRIWTLHLAVALVVCARVNSVRRVPSQSDWIICDRLVRRVVHCGTVRQLLEPEQAGFVVAIAVDDVPAPSPTAQPIHVGAEARYVRGMKECRVQRRDDAEVPGRHDHGRRKNQRVHSRILKAEARALFGAWCVAVTDQHEIERDLLARARQVQLDRRTSGSGLIAAICGDGSKVRVPGQKTPKRMVPSKAFGFRTRFNGAEHSETWVCMEPRLSFPLLPIAKPCFMTFQAYDHSCNTKNVIC